VNDEIYDLINRFSQSVCKEFVKWKLTRPLIEMLDKNKDLLVTKQRILKDKKSEFSQVSSKRAQYEHKVKVMDERQLQNKETTLAIEANYVRSENLLTKILAVGENARKKAKKIQSKIDNLKGDCLIMTLSMYILGYLNQEVKSFWLRRWQSALTLNEVAVHEGWAQQS